MINNILLFIWELPQRLIALLILMLFKKQAIYKGEVLGNKIYYIPIIQGGISLGKYIYLESYKYDYAITHECGHSKQSTYLGWSYLVIIGLPSVVNNLLHRVFINTKYSWNYYNFYTERWANKIMNIKK